MTITLKQIRPLLLGGLLFLILISTASADVGPKPTMTFEAVFLYFTNRRRGISLVHATVLSLFMNFASFLFTFFVIG